MAVSVKSAIKVDFICEDGRLEQFVTLNTNKYSAVSESVTLSTKLHLKIKLSGEEVPYQITFMLS